MILITKMHISKGGTFAEAGPIRDRVVGMSWGAHGDGWMQMEPNKKSQAPESDLQLPRATTSVQPIGHCHVHLSVLACPVPGFSSAQSPGILPRRGSPLWNGDPVLPWWGPLMCLGDITSHTHHPVPLKQVPHGTIIAAVCLDLCRPCWASNSFQRPLWVH